MKGKKKTACPYCGEPLNYAKAWTLRRHGEYICPKCGGLSNVHLDRSLYTIGLTVIVVSVVIFVLGLIFDTSLAPFTLGAVFLMFLAFFLVSPLFVRLRKPSPPRPPQRKQPQEPPRYGRTL
jgi:amino acid transporter